MANNIKDESPLVQRVIGVRVHGIRNFMFLVDENMPGGANLICEVLRRVLLDLDAKGELPNKDPTLYLQVDNCGENSNKNKVMFVFLTHLVRLGIFNKIKAGFLMVAHTHEDVDQMFSTVATHLQNETVVCPDCDSLLYAIKQAFQNPAHQPQVEVLSPLQMFDYTSFYTPHIDPKIHHHQEPHQFRIKAFFLRQTIQSSDCTSTLQKLGVK